MPPAAPVQPATPVQAATPVQPAHDRPQPRYRQVAEMLAGELASGRLKAGSRLLGERDLCRHFAVSRVTLRKALGLLRDRGLVESDMARGWFVAATLGEPNALISFTEMAAQRGLQAGARVLEQQVRAATLDEADLLGIAPGAELFSLRRLRLLDGVPVGVELSRLPAALLPAAVVASPLTGSLYAALAAAGVVPQRADYVVEAVAADAAQAVLLEVEPGAPLLRSTATTRDSDRRPIELSDNVFRGDRYRFRTTLVRRAPPAAAGPAVRP